MYNNTIETQKGHDSANAVIEIEVGRMENISDNTKEKSQITKYTVKDSVFTSLFKDKKYLLQLYRALHPEDKKTTEDQLTDITIKNILTDGMYNDLGFMAGDRLMILVEAQSTTETIRICKDRNVLREYLSFREKEVVDIMMTLFDEERIMQTYVANKEKEAVKENAKRTAERMLRTGKLTVEEIASCCPELSIEDVRQMKEKMMQAV